MKPKRGSEPAPPPGHKPGFSRVKLIVDSTSAFHWEIETGTTTKWKIYRRTSHTAPFVFVADIAWGFWEADDIGDVIPYQYRLAGFTAGDVRNTDWSNIIQMESET